MTRDGNTPITYEQKQFNTLSLEMDECLCHVEACAIFSYALEKNKTKLQVFLALLQMQLR